MTVKDHTNRRKSIAVTSHSRSSIVPRHRRRAHSGVPSELSPYARSRLSGPFKGILKTALKPRRSIEGTSATILSTQETDTHSQSQSQPNSQELDADTTQAMELTRDYKAKIHDNFARKSMGRRVSFSETAFVRLFDTAEQTNSTGSPHSSPTLSSDPSVAPAVNDENAYSRAALAKRRRSSSRYSVGSDMDLTGVGPSTLPDTSLSDLSDDMDITEALDQNILRKRSSTAAGPLAETFSQADDIIAHDSMSFSDDPSRTEDNDTQPMEFTIPLSQALRPAHEDPVWLELQRTTHAGAVSDESMGDSLAPAESSSGRHSLGFGLTGDESFSSMEESFMDQSDGGDKTLNLTDVLGRGSLGISSGRPSDAMDESETYGHLLAVSLYPTLPLREQHAPTPVHPPISHQLAPTPTTVFSKPKSATVFTPKPSVTKSSIPVFAPRSPNKQAKSDVKVLQKPTPKQFSAAFAPPVARPSPKKVAAVPLKRIHGHDENTVGENPHKRPNLGKDAQVQSGSTAAVSMPRPLSPSKRSPFEATTNTRPVTSARRPSGYFARRKSIITGIPHAEEDGPSAATRSPNKQATLGLGLGHGASDAWKRLDKEPLPELPNLPAHQEFVHSPTFGAGALPSSPRHESPRPRSLASPSTSFQTLALHQGEDVSVGKGEHPAEEWRQTVDQEEGEDDDVPAISIEQFFEITGIKFMDDLKAPRRSMHPVHSRHPRNPSEISLADYAVALAIDIPQLVLYSRVSSDLQAWMQQSQVIFCEAEEEASKMTPELFLEYARADEEGQSELLHQLNLIRTNTRGLAKSDWYDWKLQWIEGLRSTAEQALAELQADARSLDALCSLGSDVVPSLQAEYDSVVAELENERAEVAEIEKCDQTYLNELKASIADQSIMVDGLKDEVKEENAQLTWLGERLHDIEMQKTHTRSAIAEANRILHMQSNSTESEVLRLQHELEDLENLHMFRVTKVSSREFEFVHASQFLVHIPCVNFIPAAAKIQITPLESIRTRCKDDFPVLSRFFLATAHALVQATDKSIREIVYILRDYWSSCLQLRMQLKHLSVGFPLDITTSPSELSIAVSILFSEKKALAVASFHFDRETFSRWPCSIESMRYNVDVTYGNLDREYIFDVMHQTLNEKTSAENYACLAEACLEAQKAQC